VAWQAGRPSRRLPGLPGRQACLPGSPARLAGLPGWQAFQAGRPPKQACQAKPSRLAGLWILPDPRTLQRLQKSMNAFQKFLIGRTRVLCCKTYHF